MPDRAAAAPRPRYDPTAVARLLAATGRSLIELLAVETDHLRAARPAAIAPLSGEKSRLSEIFAAGWRHFETGPDELAKLAPELREELRAVALRLDAAAAENAAALRIARRASELVIAAIAGAIERQRPRPTYTAGRIPRILPRQQAGIGFSRTA